MIKTGIDIIEISRFDKMDKLDLFEKKVFTKNERSYFDSKKKRTESVAAFFVAKEAFAKFMGSGFRGFSFKDIEILHDELGKPYILFMGKRVKADLSITHSDISAAAVVCGEESELNIINPEYIKEYHALLPKRREDMHKGDCGRVFVLAGSRGMTGAAALCATAALRSGSGLITVGCPDSQQAVLAVKLTEVMTLPLPEINGKISGDAIEMVKQQSLISDVCAVGPGLGRSDGIWKCIEAVLAANKPILLDADGLNSIAEHINVLESSHAEIVMTPHPGEMSRLCSLSIAEIEANREKIAVEFAKKYNVTLLLKGNHTVVASPRGEVHINPTGNSGMATGGMGDVLSGIIASFIGQGLSGFNAAVLGAFLHGFAGDIAAKKIGKFGMTASDVISNLPEAIEALNY